MRLWEKLVFFALAIIFLVSFFIIIWKISNLYTVEVPTYGGTLTEGIIGTPRFINPVLASSDADRDITALVYSGLMRADNNGRLINDMAEKYEISEDGLVYIFTLKPDLVWQDGEPITADDIVFTIEKIKDPSMKSPKRGGWEGVSAEKVDDKTVKFSLKKQYAPFMENTTLGILPMHIWETMSSDQIASSEMNTRPIGSGPYKISEIKRNSVGIISSYEMNSNNNFALGRPNIKKMIMRFYSSEKEILDAYQKGEVEAINAINPQELAKIKTSNNIQALYLPRIFGLFLNQNNAKVLTKKEIRQALDLSVDRKKIIDDVLNGFGAELFHPLPQGTFGALSKDETMIYSPEKAKELLDKNGWKMNTAENVLEKKIGKEVFKFSFSISTSDAPELKETANLLKSMWEAIGAMVDVRVFEHGDLSQNIIRPRKYDSLLFGEVVGRDPDPFAFWHSSQRNDPGLNVAIYANIKVDNILEEARGIEDEVVRAEKYKEFQEEVAKDTPAIFLFSPKFIYITPKNLKGLEAMEKVTIPSERFSMIHQWYKATNKVWKIFAN
ncbi:MAG: peptide ABC transporter substrate-binding protein [Patescibacteria group bacterium]